MPEVTEEIQTTDSRRRPQPEEGPLDIIYEDDSMLVVNKPPGLVVHPTYKNTSGTLLNAVLWRVRGRAGAQPGILTRLDKDTSGLVVIGLTPAVHAALQKDASAGRTTKLYLAIVCGSPEPAQGRIVLALARDPDDRRRVIVTRDGTPCETRYETLSTNREHSIVRCELLTGRTHQIRVHMATSGWPILGDKVYGRPDAPIARQALHAWRVTLLHPITRQPLQLEAPVPDDMRGLTLVGPGPLALGSWNPQPSDVKPKA
jgi:23S rRNA pseudouridine1911/1915/1917 synthase